MNLKRFFAKDMRTALAEIKEELGSDAIIMSSKKVSGGIEIVAAIDNKSDVNNPKTNSESERELAEDVVNISSKGNVVSQKNVVNNAKGSQERNKQEKFADSLAALLARQEQQPTKNRPVSQNLNNKNVPPSLGARNNFQNYFNTEKTEPTAAKVVDSKNSLIDMAKFNDLSKEVESIRKLLQFQLAGLMNDERNRDEPIRAMLIRLLTAAGFDEKLAIKVTSRVNQDVSFNVAWQEMARILENNLQVGSDAILKNGGAIALIGPTGVGKTTTLAKLAARFALKYGSEQVALVSTDHYRIGASEQLQTYGRIMGCVVKVVDDVSSLAEVLYQLRNKSLVLIDTAGFGQRDARLEQELMELEKSAKVHLQHYLVLPGTAQRRVLEDAYARFSPVGIDGLILTKLDESLNLGDALSMCLSYKLPLSYVTTGQRVPEDIEVADAKSFIALVLSQIEDNEPNMSVARENDVPSGLDWARNLDNTD